MNKLILLLIIAGSVYYFGLKPQKTCHDRQGEAHVFQGKTYVIQGCYWVVQK